MTAAPTTFCRHCGTPLAAGTRFCGRCGGEAAAAPVAPAAPTPTAYAPPPAAGAYGGPAGYPPPAAYQAPTDPAPPAGHPPTGAAAGWGQPGANAPTGLRVPAGYGFPEGLVPGTPVPPARRQRSALWKVGALVVALVVVGSVILRVVQGGTPSRCVYACGPDVGGVQPAADTYTSPLRFSFTYPALFSQSTPPKGVEAEFGTHNLQTFLVTAGRGSPSETTLLTQAVQDFAANFTQVSPVGALNGASIGGQAGAGALYSGYLQLAANDQVPVRFFVIVAEKGGIWAVVSGFGGTYEKAQPTGVNGGFLFDSVLSSWVWPS